MITMQPNSGSAISYRSLLVGLVLASTASAENKDLIDLMTTPLGEKDLAARLEMVGDFRQGAKGRFPLKKFYAFSIPFHGAISHSDHDPQTIWVTSEDADLSPADAARASAMVEEAISVSLGEGREVKDIPNHEDATPVKSRGRIWAGPQGSVILLKTDDYTNRANFSVVRYVDSFSLAESGEAKDFWLDHLKIIWPKGESDDNLQWLAKHSAGVVIDQLPNRRGTYQESLTYQGHQLPLTEDPPYFERQLTVGKTPILLGHYDTRHRVHRVIHSLRTDGNELKREAEISVDSPRTGGSGGFVFVTDGDSISRFGVIVPVVTKIPEGDDPTASQWSTEVKFHHKGRGKKNLSLDEIPLQEIHPEWKVLMRRGILPQKVEPETVKIIWYRVEPSGDFKLDM